MENPLFPLDRDSNPAGGAALFRGRTLVIATMHGKEAVLAPPLENALGVRCHLPEKLNTDVFGTFTGGIKRPGTALDAARLKVRQALALTGQTLGLASEGSFGPHPYLPFLATDLELLLLLDTENNLEITAEVLSTQTNFGSCVATTMDEVMRFAEQSLFPAHGLIVQAGPEPAVKGIRQPGQLRALAEQWLARYSELTLQTDMRAMHNPTRLAVIADCARQLLENVRRVCPACGRPGYALIERLPGLPCSHCRLPTRRIRADRYGCAGCGHQQEDALPNGEPYADPMYCDFCNP